MSYYESSSSSNGQWPTNQNTWDHQVPPTRGGANGPTSQDEFAFFYQFDEVDRAFDNLSKSGKSYGASGRHSRGPTIMAGPRQPHGSDYGGEGPRGHPPSNIQGFYANQRHQPSRGSSEAEQMMQAKRRMAAQRERELRNLHTEQQYQRTALPDVSYVPKGMSEEETRELIARQRSALYKEGPFAEKNGYVDENGVIRPGIPTHSGPASLRGASPATYDLGRNLPGNPESASIAESAQNTAQEVASRPNSTTSPQSNSTNSKAVFDSTIGQPANRTSTSSPGGSPPRQELPGAPKSGQSGGATVAPIGTRPSGTPVTNSSAKRSTPPLASPGSWGRSGWPQSSGLGGQASVWA
ncbi:uncharacterized protein DNG_02920 [Cephalotrichum gorgonifer]|uniref:Uncharacterized protein n=1 Tax=Cephalotrichum gorgonifer TaxID=2041049 RepID=A0AAE8MV86_9PEZI|nr:uncharacterized protein DNG_02920 [Cephalotrichum gorgonifer]